ncbi:PAS domain-containing sensor histidine kinase [Lutibacter citreus]|uniref:PAS domain-containing sensor histidine kinase n=1 Tax=Lutibacter citreus TaxID=2138210 RepID=UPI0015CFC156|nr:PAS domain-containing sensor histidine kinase [Lutibacter citreus]
MRKITRPVGFVFCAVFVIQSLHIINILQNHQSDTDYFKSSPSESIFLLSWETISILLVYAISLMYNKRLIFDVNAQEEKFSKAFHAAPFIVILSKLTNGEIFEVNKNTLSIAGYEPNELMGINEINLWNNNNHRLKFISELKSKKSINEREYIFRKKSGELFTGLITANIININDEQCVISVINDITNSKKAELKLRESEATLRELNSTKDKFFSIIAHDLKSPFSGILGFSEILSHQVKEKNYQGIDKYAEIINSSSKYAMELLSNLMEWSRSQTGRMEFNPEYIDLDSIIKSTLELLKPTSEQKLISIVLNTPIKITLHADKAMIEAILRNLISNAIKFTPQKGTINITAKENEKEYLISVIDGGVGIEKSNLEKLFQIDSSYSTLGTEKEKGTGLGLILCKDFIDKHRGKIWAESELGIGSKFYFSLPKK